MLGSRSLPGSRITTGRGRTRPLAIEPRRRSPPNWISNGLLRCALRAPLRSPLLQPRRCAKQTPGSNPNWGKAGGHVTTTTPWPRRSTGSTRPRSSIGDAHGVRWKRSNTPPWTGSTGSTTAAYSSRSATSRRPRPKSHTTKNWIKPA